MRNYKLDENVEVFWQVCMVAVSQYYEGKLTDEDYQEVKILYDSLVDKVAANTNRILDLINK
jgi:hypothetical protein